MDLIGVTGMSGAGKTTFSNYLKENSNDIEVIHIDDLIKEVKLKYFGFLMKKNEEGEKTKVGSKLKTFLYKNKPIFFLFSKMKAKLIESSLNKRLEECKGKRIVIIEDTFIKQYKPYKDFKQIYLIERPYVDRKEALQKRDHLTKEEIVAYDMAHFTGNYKEIKDDIRLRKIQNNGDYENLKEQARKIYLEKMVSKREKMLMRNKVIRVGNIRVLPKEQVPKIKEAGFSR